MARTPDRFPGEREDEGVILEPGSVSPTVNGEIRYVTLKGFRFFEEGIERKLCDLDRILLTTEGGIIYLNDGDYVFKALL